MLTVHQCHGRTDGQTDGRTTYDSNTALCVVRASRGKKRKMSLVMLVGSGSSPIHILPLAYRVKDFSDDMVIMHLITSYCKTSLLYACECFNVSCSEVLQLCSAWRCVYWSV